MVNFFQIVKYVEKIVKRRAGMDRRPVISHAGDRALFARLEGGLHAGLPTEAVEWKRSYGRSSRTVCVEVDFQPFNAEELIQV